MYLPVSISRLIAVRYLSYKSGRGYSDTKRLTAIDSLSLLIDSLFPDARSG